jgi:hypothetical protein
VGIFVVTTAFLFEAPAKDMGPMFFWLMTLFGGLFYGGLFALHHFITSSLKVRERRNHGHAGLLSDDDS